MCNFIDETIGVIERDLFPLSLDERDEVIYFLYNLIQEHILQSGG